MVQSIENRAVVTGRVVRLRTEGDVAHIDVAVDGTESVEGFPNLLAPSAGTELTISIKGQAPELVAGDRFRGVGGEAQDIAGPCGHLLCPPRLQHSVAPGARRA